MKSLPLIKAQGAPFELGLQHGRQCAELIQHAVREVFPRFLSQRNAQSMDQVKAGAVQYEPFITRYAPHLLEEVRGLAEGARITWEEAMLLQTRPEVGNARLMAAAMQECTSVGVTPERSEDGHPIICQNVDMGEELRELGIVLHLQPESGPSILTWTLAGVVGQTGINSAGLGRCGNVLFSKGWRLGVPTSILFRMALEQTTVDGIIELCRETPRAKSNNFLACDASGRVSDLEMTVDEQREIGPEDGLILHANHYCHPDLQACEVNPRAAGSNVRQQRLAQMVAEDASPMTPQRLMTMLRDHENRPDSICAHSRAGSQTLTSCILVPTKGEMYATVGNPCEAEYVRYSL